jgi:hypothetical protein
MDAIAEKIQSTRWPEAQHHARRLRLRRLGLLFFFTAALAAAMPARASSTCSSVLTADQVAELNRIVFPTQPYSPHLGEAVDGDPVQGSVKRLTAPDSEKLRGAISHPYTGAVRDVQSQDDIADLKMWLRANSSAEFPAWDATAVEANPPSAWVPRAWLGRTADEFFHLVKEAGNAGPIKGTRLGSATSLGRTLGVTHHISADSSGRDMFVWSYIYQATVGGQLLTTLLAVCQAEVVTMSNDERDLRLLEQQLARAWAARDRPTIERILGHEWSVTASDGATVSRAAMLGATFDSNARIVEAMTTDDDGVTVMRFDAAAVVRGRTVATVWLAGIRQTNAVRFMDVFIKRQDGWQLVASHHTSVTP